MKAVILSGSPGTALFPFANCYPKLMLPLANEPLIKYTINSLRRSGITEIAVISSSSKDCGKSLIDTFNRASDKQRVFYFKEMSLQGTAGSLKQLESFIAHSHFLILGSHIIINGLDFSNILDFHLTQKAGITMVVEYMHGKTEELENVEIGSDGIVSRVHMLHHSRNNRKLLSPTGIYVFSPNILDHINEKGYMDIKEQLIPKLHEKGIPVYAYTLKRSLRKINSNAEYFYVNREILLGNMNGSSEVFHTGTEIMNGVWIGKNVNIQPNVYLLGPVVIGDNCTIENHSHIIGPTSIGRGSHIEKNVLIRESIIWENTHLKNSARIEYSLISNASVISQGETVNNSVVINEKKYSGCINIISLINGNGDPVIKNNSGVFSSISYRTARYKLFRVLKRGLDICFSSFGLLFFLPLFIIIAAVIKLDSLGPVLFRQKRCGREGKEFTMYKFRTMVRDADKKHKMLIDHNDIDGPMFKMANDPRITRFGKILRRTSLDELPQLFNVLMGDMSLVGPRPLIMEEMKFAPHWRDIRLNVKPGMTGLWQIVGRDDSSFHHWIELDIAYVKNQSIWMDIRVLIKTVYFVARCIGRK